MLNLKKKNILLTGAGGLLGSEFASSLIKNGATVYALDIDIGKLKKLETRLKKKKLHKKLKCFKIDITKKNQLLELFHFLSKKKIFIDTIINNASNNHPPKTNEFDNWDNDIQVSLTSTKNIIEIFVKKMVKKKIGNIINIGSDLSIIAPNQKLYSDLNNYIKPLSYSVTKHGIVGLTKYYASLYAKNKIRVNCLSPGGVENNQNKKFIKKIKNVIPLGRMAKKKEYNEIIVFLCSDATSYMTGHNLIVDGGRTII